MLDICVKIITIVTVLLVDYVQIQYL